MGRRQSALLLLSASALAAVASCHRPAASDAALTIGVEAQPAVVSRIGKLHYSAKVGATSLVDKEIIPKTGVSPFPFEIPLTSPAGAQVDVVIEAFSAGPNDTIASTPMLVRSAHAPFVAGPPELVRLRLESKCLTRTPGFKGPTCPATQSCSNGRCIDPTLLADDLEPYAKDWAKNRPDACKPPHAGEPVITLGTGQTDYAKITDGETLTPEKGPQGGHHLWIALQMKNLRQNGSTVVVTAEQPGTGLKVPPTSFVFPFEPAEGGGCKLYGLRLQLDNSSVPVQSFLGKPLDLNVSVSDVDGKTAETHGRVTVAAKTIEDTTDGGG
jgi:hypothetical protein